MKLLENFLLGPGFFEKRESNSPDRNLQQSQRNQAHILRKLLEERE